MCVTQDMTVLIDQSLPVNGSSNFLLKWFCFKFLSSPSPVLDPHKGIKERLFMVVGNRGTFWKGFS